MRYLIFSDLDGTLLDHHSYSFAPAAEALESIRRKNIPLILASSKTRAEIEAVRAALGNHDPFIAENGGAVVVPQDYFDQPIEHDKEKDGYWIIELGTPYEELRRALKAIRSDLGVKLVGFGDMSVEEVAESTNLSRQEAAVARQREYDEPFVAALDDAALTALESAVAVHHLRLTRGGRFFHLMGDNDKGRAVRIVIELFEKAWKEPTRSVALGDSLNDLPMLAAVDVPVLVQKPDGNYDARVRERLNVELAPAVGPAGWNAAVLELLGSAQ